MHTLTMLKYLLGLVLVQVATVVVVLLAPADLQGVELLRVAIPALFIACVTAFWFASLAHHLRKDELAKVSEQFARERENLRVNAERSKARAMKKAQKDLAKESRMTHARANFKVGAAFAGVIGVGALLMLTQFLTIGIVALSTAGGALGGYLYRGHQHRKALQRSPGVRLIEAQREPPQTGAPPGRETPGS